MGGALSEGTLAVPQHWEAVTATLSSGMMMMMMMMHRLIGCPRISL